MSGKLTSAMPARTTNRRGAGRTSVATLGCALAPMLLLSAAPTAHAAGNGFEGSAALGSQIVIPNTHVVTVSVYYNFLMAIFKLGSPPQYANVLEPLSGATVTVPGGSATSANTGTTNQFSLRVSNIFNTTVTVACAGYTSQPVVIAPSATSVSVTLIPAPAVTTPTPYAGFTGTIEDAEDAVSPATSVPVANATVTCTVNGQAAGATTTGANGGFTIPVSGGLKSGATVGLTVSAYGYKLATQSYRVSGSAASTASDYSLSPVTLTPNGKAVFWNGSMGYVYGCNYANWEYDQDFAPNGSAYWYDSQPTSTYDTTNVDPSNGNRPTSIEDGFAHMGNDLGDVNGKTPMRVVRWMLFTDMSQELQWSSGTTSAGATVTGITSNTYNEIDRGLTYAAQNNMRILFTLVTFYGFEPTSNYGGNHRAVATTSEVLSGASVGSRVQDSYVNNAVIPVLKHITSWEQTNVGNAALPTAKNVVFAYDICNEPDQWMKGTAPNGTTFTGTYMTGDTGNDANALLSESDVRAFTTRCATAIHAYGGPSLATLGVSNPSVACAFSGCGLDFYSVHYYGFWSDATAYGNNGLPTAWSLGSGLPACSAIGLNGAPLDKPVVVEECQTANQPDDRDTAGNSFTGEWCLNRIQSLGYAGAMGWSFVSSYSNDVDYPDGGGGYNYNPIGNWDAFEPTFKSWPASNAWNPATGTGVVIGPN